MTDVASRFRSLRRAVRSRHREPHPDLVHLTEEDRRYLTSLHDDRVALPPGAEHELSSDNPRLVDLRRRYSELDVPATRPSRWSQSAVESFLDLRYFRGETLITWHYRELPRITELKFFVFMQYVRARDPQGILGRLGEDGLFGCWTFSYPEYGTFSRDLLESVNEIQYLDRQLGLSNRETLRVLDVGAGYGRLAHRMTAAFPKLSDYACVDAVPESTFLSDYYLQHRGCVPPARVVPLDRTDSDLHPGTFDLAVNIHSFSECTYAAVEWWVDLLRRLEVPRLLIVPNEPEELLTLEPDETRRDFMPLLERAGFHLERRDPVIDDLAVRELLQLHDHFHLFSR
jgi:SAM-dependent methyltransferase